MDEKSEKEKNLMENIFLTFSRWERVQLARHPRRPFSLDYIKHFSNNFIELHGDRHFGDDPAVIAGIGSFGDYKVVWIGQQKAEIQKRTFLETLE